VATTAAIGSPTKRTLPTPAGAGRTRAADGWAMIAGMWRKPLDGGSRRREDAHDAVEIRRRRGVDPEARVWYNAARERHVTNTRKAQVVEERRLPA